MIPLRLDPDDVEAIAERVAELLGRGTAATASDRWLSTAEVAVAFGRSPEWVRDHASELGGRKIGGPRAPWRFPAACLDAVHQATGVAEPPVPARRRRVARPTVALLPIRN